MREAWTNDWTKAAYALLLEEFDDPGQFPGHALTEEQAGQRVREAFQKKYRRRRGGPLAAAFTALGLEMVDWGQLARVLAGRAAPGSRCPGWANLETTLACLALNRNPALFPAEPGGLKETARGLRRAFTRLLAGEGQPEVRRLAEAALKRVDWRGLAEGVPDAREGKEASNEPDF